jgi:Tfp pilus assembly protein PilV
VTVRQTIGGSRPAAFGFSLVEALIAMVILGIMVTGIVGGFMQCHRTAEWSAHSLAAQSLAMQPIEQARAAKWDPWRSVPIDELVSSNFPMTTNILDVPISGTNIVYATNVVTIRTVSTNPPLKEIYVETRWKFDHKRLYTNWAVTYRTADQ